MQDHVRHHSVSLLFVIQSISRSITHSGLFLKLHTFFQPHILQKLFQSKFSEVTLCLILSCQRLSQFVCPVTNFFTLFYGVFYGSIQSHHRLLILLSAFLNSILHVYNILLQGIKNCCQRLLILFCQLFGAFLQNLLRSSIHLLLHNIHLQLQLFLLLLFQHL